MSALVRNISLSLLCLSMFVPFSLSAEEPVYIVRSTKSVAEDPAFVKLLGEAKVAQKKANSVGGEWRDVGKFLTDAEKAADGGDLDKAMKLAQKAKSQSEIGYEQAVKQKGKVEYPSFLK